MRVLVTGATGQLGSNLVEVLGQDHEVLPTNRDAFDIVDLRAGRTTIAEVRPEAVVHAAAFTDVDACETQSEKAFAVNSLGARNVAIAANECGAKLFYISTDYVFDGTKGSPYVEFDPVNPLSAYGKSKLWGEAFVREQTSRHFILRTAWLYGHNGGNFISTMLRLAGEKGEINVVDDQRGTPTWSLDVARQIEMLLETEAYGTYHCTSQGSCSRYEFALEIFRLADYEICAASNGGVLLVPPNGLSALDSGSVVRNSESLPVTPESSPRSSQHPDSIRLRPVPTSNMRRPAIRPKDSTLDNLMLRLHGLDTMPPWKDALAKYMKIAMSNR